MRPAGAGFDGGSGRESARDLAESGEFAGALGIFRELDLSNSITFVPIAAEPFEEVVTRTWPPRKRQIVFVLAKYESAFINDQYALSGDSMQRLGARSGAR